MQGNERYLVIFILLLVSGLVALRGYNAYRKNVLGGRGYATRSEHPKMFWLQIWACVIFSTYCVWFAFWILLPEVLPHPPLLKQYAGQVLD